MGSTSTNAARQRKFKARRTERRQYVRNLADDIRIEVTETPTSIKIDYWMTDEHMAKVNEWCAARGYTFDDLARDIQAETMAKATRDARRLRK